MKPTARESEKKSSNSNERINERIEQNVNYTENMCVGAANLVSWIQHTQKWFFFCFRWLSRCKCKLVSVWVYVCLARTQSMYNCQWDLWTYHSPNSIIFISPMDEANASTISNDGQIKPKPHSQIPNISHIANDLALKFMAWKSIIYIESNFCNVCMTLTSGVMLIVLCQIRNDLTRCLKMTQQSTAHTRQRKPKRNTLTLSFFVGCVLVLTSSLQLSTHTLTVLMQRTQTYKTV